MQVVFDAPNLKLGWDEELGCIYIKWQGFAYGEEFKGPLEKLLQILRENGGHKELSNVQKFRIARQEDLDWILNSWLPRAEKAGLRCTAFVVPQSPLARKSLDSMLSKLDERRNKWACFETEEEARQWLRDAG